MDEPVLVERRGPVLAALDRPGPVVALGDVHDQLPHSLARQDAPAGAPGCVVAADLLLAVRRGVDLARAAVDVDAARVLVDALDYPGGQEDRSAVLGRYE